MPIVVRLDVVLAKRKMRSNELAQAIGLSEPNVSLLKSGKVRAIRLSTLEAICAYLHCQPGDILEYVPGEETNTVPDTVIAYPSRKHRA